MQGARRRARRALPRAGELPGRRHGRARGRGPARGDGHLPRQLLRPARAQGQAPAARAAGRRRGPVAASRWRRARSAAASAAPSASSIPRSRPGWCRNKAEHIEATGAELLLAGDLGCLLNMAGRLKRLGSARAGAPCSRGAGRRRRHAGDRRGRALSQGIRGRWKPPRSPSRTTPTRRWPIRCSSRRWPGSRPAGSPDRARAAGRLPEFEALRDQGRDIKNHSLAHLDLYLEAFEAKVVERRRQRALGARRGRGAGHRAGALPSRSAPARVTKSKSMITEEIGLNAYLESNGLEPVETDLGEYILQISRPAAEPHRRPGRPHDQGRDQRPVRAAPWRPAARGGVRSGGRGAPDHARALSRAPTSASPAPIS